jgi:hypothetical protein
MDTLVFCKDNFKFKIDVEYVGEQVNIKELNDKTNALAKDFAGLLDAEFMYVEMTE